MDYRSEDRLNGGIGAAVIAAQVKVQVCGLVLLLLRLNSGPLCDDSAAEGSVCKCSAICT